ncbi:MAG: hypothetical protein ACRDV8_02695, partial [Acidimicrobiales bacterium]
LIHTFKSMMSIHEATLGPDDGDDGEGADRPGTDTRADAESNGLTDVRELGELAALQGVVKFPVRIKCATLSWNALAQGLDEVESG